MVEFALAMDAALTHLNHDSFQNFELRVGALKCDVDFVTKHIPGVSYGPVVAGVIGARCPQYDIWGNTVNMASRMDSHGCRGKIHVSVTKRAISFKESF